MTKVCPLRAAVLVLLLASLAACSASGEAPGDADALPDGDAAAGTDAEPDGDVATDGQADGAEDGDFGADLAGDAARDADADAPLRRERACLTELVYDPSGAAVTTVELAGEWNGWQAEAMREGDDGVWRAERDLEPGIHCYKLVVDGEWRLDPGNSYQAYCDEVQNSGARVPDRALPLLALESAPTVGGGGFAARVFFSGGCDGTGPAQVTATLVHGFEQSAVDAVFDERDWSLEVALSGLEPGKYTVRIDARDLAGRAAERLLLPFWVEDEPFSWADAVIYMIMTDRFVNGEPANDPAPDPSAEPTVDWYGGDLQGITSTIESGYFDELGIRALWITPFNTGALGTYPDASGERGVTGYHGYWPIEPRSIDPRLGSEEDLRALVTAAHGRGIRLLMDLVVNHVHEDHRYYRDHPEWFNDGCMCGTDGCDWTDDRLTCLFAPYMPDLDWRQEEASEQLIEDALWWLETFDLDGFRIDAVKHVDDLAVFNLGTRVTETFEQAGTDYYLNGETAMGWGGDDPEASQSEYDTISRYIGPNGLDGQFDFVLFHAVASLVLAWGERTYVHLDFWTLQSQLQYPEGAIMTPYLGSHDTSRFLSRSDYRGQDEAHPRGVAENKWADLPEPPDEDEPYDRARLGFCWLLTVPGAPLVYQGDEYGEYGGADPDNRHMLRAEDDLQPREAALLADVRTLGRVRQGSVALRRGEYVSLGADGAFLAFVRQSNTDAALVVLNGDATEAVQELDLSATALAHADALSDALGWGAAAVVAGSTATVTVPPRSCAVLTAR
jgi:neopullulanase